MVVPAAASPNLDFFPEPRMLRTRLCDFDEIREWVRVTACEHAPQCEWIGSVVRTHDYPAKIVKRPSKLRAVRRHHQSSSCRENYEDILCKK